MPSLANNVSGANNSTDPAIQALSNAHQSLVANINSTPAFVGVSGGNYPINAVPGSFTAEAITGGVNFGVVDSSRTVPQIFTLTQAMTKFAGVIDHAGDPTVADFPQDGSYGWFRNDTSGAYGFVLNDAGSVVYQNFVYLSGTISVTQHGDLHGLGGTSHDFTQISGVITAAQHGNLTGGALHAAATGSANGFMTTTQVGQLATNTTNIASIQTTVTDITSTGSVSELLNCIRLDVNGTTVVQPRDTAWTFGYASSAKSAPNYTFQSPPVKSDVDAIYGVVCGILATLQYHGLIG